MHKELRVGLGFSFFDSAKEIPRALDPLYKHFYKLYCVDGRYINYETDHDLSQDGSVELLERRYPNSVVEKVKPLFQTEKRNKYFEMAGEDNCDYLIVWDSDDLLWPEKQYQDWDRFWKSLKAHTKKYPEHRIFKMKSWIPDKHTWRKAWNARTSNSWAPYIRIHKNPGEQRYCLYCHYWFAPKDATDEDLMYQRRGMYRADHTIDGIRLTTNSFLRGEKQLDTRDNWAWNNINEEQRRLYIKQNNLFYNQGKLEFNGYWRYDKVGRPISKICEEDGSPPKDVNEGYHKDYQTFPSRKH